MVWYRHPDSESFFIPIKDELSGDHCLTNFNIFLILLTKNSYRNAPLLIIEPPKGYGDFIKDMILTNVEEIGIAFSNVALLAFDYYNIKKGLYLHLSPSEHCIACINKGKIVKIIDIDVNESKPIVVEFSIPKVEKIIDALDKIITKVKNNLKIVLSIECDSEKQTMDEFNSMKLLLKKYNIINDTPFHYLFAAQELSRSKDFSLLFE